jgi:hypothetical protein
LLIVFSSLWPMSTGSMASTCVLISDTNR